MRILLTGANGLLGQKIVNKSLGDDQYELIATGRGSKRFRENIQYESMDITSSTEVLAVLNRYRPQVIIHTAAMTNVDECELNHESCTNVNVLAVQNLVDASQEISAFFLQVSTDFIFDGLEGPLTESHSPSPVNFYGQTKLDAEEIVMNANLSWAIARTVLVYGVVSDMSRSNIILWVKSSLEQGKEIKVVNDQFRTPTLAEDLADGCLLIAKSKSSGIFNISGKDFLTPYEMALQTADYFKLDKSLIHETDSTKFTQPAKRPLRTGFIIDKAKNILGYAPHSFKEGIEIVASQVDSIRQE